MSLVNLEEELKNLQKANDNTREALQNLENSNAEPLAQAVLCLTCAVDLLNTILLNRTVANIEAEKERLK